MSNQSTQSVTTTRSKLQSRTTAMLATFTALMFISELVQGQVLETLNLGFGIEVPDIIGLIGLTFTGWYAAPFFAISHAIACAMAKNGAAYQPVKVNPMSPIISGTSIPNPRLRVSRTWPCTSSLMNMRAVKVASMAVVRLCSLDRVVVTD